MSKPQNAKGDAAAPLSTIRVLHARYEASIAEYGAIDDADTDLGSSQADKLLSFRYDDAKKVSDAEHDALRLAILFQIPDSWVDAMILQYHIYIMQDLVMNARGDASAQEKLALETAIDTLFDFMACEIDQDHEELGAQFKRGTMRVWERRRFRTGEVEA